MVSSSYVCLFIIYCVYFKTNLFLLLYYFVTLRVCYGEWSVFADGNLNDMTVGDFYEFFKACKVASESLLLSQSLILKVLEFVFLLYNWNCH